MRGELVLVVLISTVCRGYCKTISFVTLHISDKNDVSEDRKENNVAVRFILLPALGIGRLPIRPVVRRG